MTGKFNKIEKNSLALAGCSVGQTSSRYARLQVQSLVKACTRINQLASLQDSVVERPSMNQESMV